MQLVVLRREAITKIGGFSEALPQSAQAVEASYRLRAHGYRLIHSGRPLPLSEAEKPQNPASDDVEESKAALRRRFSRLYRFAGKESCSPSHLWRNGFELQFNHLNRIQPFDIKEYPRISVIIRTYAGRRQWLRQSLVSALNQSYPNLEILVIEDGSALYQSELEAVAGEKQSDGRSIRYLSQAKLGKSAAGNLALAEATGDYTCFLDDDDLYYPHHIETLYLALSRNRSSLAAYGLAWEVHTQASADGSYEEIHYEVAKHTRGTYSQKKLEQLNYLPIQSVLFNRSLFLSEGGFDPERHFLEDWDLWLRYAKATTYTHVPVVTSLYRTTADPYERITRIRLKQRRAIQAESKAA